jgi:hypothetical protein
MRQIGRCRVEWLAIGAATRWALLGCTGESVARPPVTPAATVIGAAQSCVSISQLSETRVRDDWTIDFVLGNRVWRNALPSRCAGLKVNHAFGYETSLSQLCSTDIVYVLENVGGLRRGAACGLGEFVPVRLGATEPAP